MLQTKRAWSNRDALGAAVIATLPLGGGALWLPVWCFFSNVDEFVVLVTSSSLWQYKAYSSRKNRSYGPCLQSPGTPPHMNFARDNLSTLHLKPSMKKIALRPNLALKLVLLVWRYKGIYQFTNLPICRLLTIYLLLVHIVSYYISTTIYLLLVDLYKIIY